MELEIKHLAPYLPYRLEGIATFLEDTIFVVDTLNSRTLRIVGETLFGNNVPIGCFLKEFKPILRPLSEIEDDEDNTVESISKCCYSYVLELISKHFDVFGLIDKGLAINYNTLSSVD